MMKRSLSLFRVAVLILLPIIAVASAVASGITANVSWVAPTQYTDGTALAASDIDHYTVSACEVNAPGTCVTATIKAPATTGTLAVVCSQYDFTVTVTTGANATYPNATSSPSSVVPYASGVSCTPKAVTGVTVN